MDRIFTRLILKWFWDFWDNFYTLILMNLAACALALTVVGLPFALGAVLEVGAQAAEGREPTWEAFRQGMRRRWLLMLGVLLLAALVVVCVGAAVSVYPQMFGAPGYLLAGLTIWIGLGMLLALLYAPVFVVRQGKAFPLALQQSLLLLLAHPFFTLYLGMLMLALLVLSVGGFPVMLPFLSFIMWSVGSHAAWTVLMRRYLLAAHPDAEATAAISSTPAKSWKEMKQRAQAQQQLRKDIMLENDEMQRRFSEILRPWDYEAHK